MLCRNQAQKLDCVQDTQSMRSSLLRVTSPNYRKVEVWVGLATGHRIVTAKCQAFKADGMFKLIC